MSHQVALENSVEKSIEGLLAEDEPHDKSASRSNPGVTISTAPGLPTASGHPMTPVLTPGGGRVPGGGNPMVDAFGSNPVTPQLSTPHLSTPQLSTPHSVPTSQMSVGTPKTDTSQLGVAAAARTSVAARVISPKQQPEAVTGGGPKGRGPGNYAQNGAVEVYDPDFEFVLTLHATKVFHTPPTNLGVSRLVLCRNFTIDDPANSCARGEQCKFVHADVSQGRKQTIHVNYAWRSLEAVTYPRLPPGDIVKCSAPNNRPPIDEIPSNEVLATRGALLRKSDVHLSHCAHYYFNRMCNRGDRCNFIHGIHIDPNATDFQRAPAPSTVAPVPAGRSTQSVGSVSQTVSGTGQPSTTAAAQQMPHFAVGNPYAHMGHHHQHHHHQQPQQPQQQVPPGYVQMLVPANAQLMFAQPQHHQQHNAPQMQAPAGMFAPMSLVVPHPGHPPTAPVPASGSPGSSPHTSSHRSSHGSNQSGTVSMTSFSVASAGHQFQHPPPPMYIPAPAGAVPSADHHHRQGTPQQMDWSFQSGVHNTSQSVNSGKSGSSFAAGSLSR